MLFKHKQSGVKSLLLWKAVSDVFPVQYKKVDYIESADGYAYIDTGVKVFRGSVITLKFDFN